MSENHVFSQHCKGKGEHLLHMSSWENYALLPGHGSCGCNSSLHLFFSKGKHKHFSGQPCLGGGWFLFWPKKCLRPPFIVGKVVLLSGPALAGDPPVASSHFPALFPCAAPLRGRSPRGPALIDLPVIVPCRFKKEKSMASLGLMYQIQITTIWSTSPRPCFKSKLFQFSNIFLHFPPHAVFMINTTKFPEFYFEWYIYISFAKKFRCRIRLLCFIFICNTGTTNLRRCSYRFYSLSTKHKPNFLSFYHPFSEGEKPPKNPFVFFCENQCLPPPQNMCFRTKIVLNNSHPLQSLSFVKVSVRAINRATVTQGSPLVRTARLHPLPVLSFPGSAARCFPLHFICGRCSSSGGTEG